MMPTRRSVVVTPVAALLIASATACGGGSDNADRPDHTTKATASAAATSDHRTAAQLATDRRVARKALLRLSDFPNGWQAKPHKDDDAGPDVGKQLADCLDVPKALLGGDEDDSVDSPDFESPDNQQVQSSVSVGPSATTLRLAFDILHRPRAATCLADAIDKVIRYSMTHDDDAPKGVHLGKVSLGVLNIAQFADESLAFRTTVPIQASGVNADIYVDFLFMRHDRAMTFLSFLNVFSPFPIDDTKRYARIAEQRLLALHL